jgi:tryptophanase
MMTKIDTTLAKAASVSISRKESTLADYKSNYVPKVNLITTEYSIGGKVTLANISDIKTIATKLGIPSTAIVTINAGKVQFTYSISEKEDKRDQEGYPRWS